MEGILDFTHNAVFYLTISNVALCHVAFCERHVALHERHVALHVRHVALLIFRPLNIILRHIQPNQAIMTPQSLMSRAHNY